MSFFNLISEYEEINSPVALISPLLKTVELAVVLIVELPIVMVDVLTDRLAPTDTLAAIDKAVADNTVELEDTLTVELPMAINPPAGREYPVELIAALTVELPRFMVDVVITTFAPTETVFEAAIVMIDSDDELAVVLTVELPTVNVVELTLRFPEMTNPVLVSTVLTVELPTKLAVVFE